jgi:prepilin-type N-terminal cleavage/methylation domain-containing protein
MLKLKSIKAEPIDPKNRRVEQLTKILGANKMVYSQQDRAAGFTLIELVMVIVIIGILAAVALPKLANLRDDSHREVTRTVMGSFKSAAKIARLKWEIEGQPATITLENSSVVNISAEGWPEPAADSNQGCSDLFVALLNISFTIVPFSGGAVDEWSALRFGTACVYINQHSTVFNNAETPFFSYFSTTGTGEEFNL